METNPHVEKHFTATETVRDVSSGMADGLTVPFALASGLSAAYFVGGLIPASPTSSHEAWTKPFRVASSPRASRVMPSERVKTHFTGVNRLRSAAQTLLVGVLAAGVAFELARTFS